MFLLRVILSVSFLSSSLWAGQIQVGSDYPQTTIAQGLAASIAGDTILVHSGTYVESGLLISHPLTLLGVDNPVIDGNHSGEIITITAKNVSIEGFILRGSGLSHLDENAAVRFEEAHGGRVSNNSFEDNFFAIYLSKSENCLIENNLISGQAKTESRSGNGIHLWYCKNINIRGNRISGHRDGIYLEFVEQCIVSQNHSSANLRYGLHFMFSNHNRYHNNRFDKNGAGVAVMYSRHVDMHNNVFADNWGSAAYGLLLKDIYDSNITDNQFNRNTVGLYSEACNRIQVEGNNFENNGWAVKIMANSMDNVFTHNNFLTNTFDIATNSRQNFNAFSQNYWNRYRGYDLDKDGIGDIPFHPVKLFSLLTEKNEPTLMLMRSIFVEIMDLAESYIPILTPATLIDAEPLMRINP
ncbi:MAG: nitrous oxide reductase family maturation protein NosD [Candidatus Marinimicrobia bacterium]|mgnify:FL=1|jgi:nitrous oxidase accessory protein|nr:nitrous oxide reductase family maturation protein NosD [Candidatus Neomarinimicrobiota bacterium]MBT7200048.1 nitrous oxide reductase family maturation protein NosD [Candidatus Neomarinimicrobiota bacterium]MBT7580022.1 nitrous oxide reductase family maturation protein NosD [Candidatus Neomarinimicrobiota bacterium]